MALNDTPGGERIHIGFFGRRNVGKSSLVNAFTGQEMSIVSEIRGTTTDPVSKSMELLPLGPVVIIDTPGIDDEGPLGEMRVKRTREILRRTDVAVLVMDGTEGMKSCDGDLLSLFEEKKIPYVIAWNKCDLPEASEGPVSQRKGDSEGEIGQGRQERQDGLEDRKRREIRVSAKSGEGIYELKELIGAFGKGSGSGRTLVGDLVGEMDLAILVIPIDFAAPRGRLILPQQQVIRDILEHGGQALCVKESELERALQTLAVPPSLVITDSQAFREVSRIVPKEIPLTSFSILMTRYKGALRQQLQGIAALRSLRDGDIILISEGCTHHRQCGDIGTEKLPKWIRAYSGKELSFEFSSGNSFPEDLSKYALIIHCGACMLTEKEVSSRNERAYAQGVAISNYGTVIAEVNGILERSIAPLPDFSI